MIPKTISDFPGDCRPSGDQIRFKHCPVCGSDRWKVYVDPVKGKWVCFAGKHPVNPNGGPGGGNLEIARDDDAPGQHIFDARQGPPEVEWAEIELPDWVPLSFGARKYLENRRISPQIAKILGLVEWEGKYRILYPYFDQSGQLVYWNSRRYHPELGEGPKYLTAPGKHPLYITPYLDIETEHTYNSAVIVEGVHDAIAVELAGYPAIALGGKTLPRYLRKYLLTSVANCGIIYVMLDRDALKNALHLRDFLASQPGIKEVRVRVPLSGCDPGDMAPEEIRKVLA